MSAANNLGAHLLGRRPSPTDERDWSLGSFLGSDTDLRDQGVTLLKQTTVGYKNHYWTTPPASSFWGQGLSVLAQIGAPPPPLPAASVVWADNEMTLDQGQTPHCVGYGCAQWGNTLPVDDKFTNPDGDALYYECKVIDGEPNAENGSDVRSGAKVLQGRGRLGSYAFAASVEEACQWVLQHGPVIIGSDWTNDMFTVDSQGFVYPTGGVAGGHAYVLLGYDPYGQVLTFLNSWGSGWAANGRFKMRQAEFVSLWSNQGEALAAVELP